MTAAELLHGRRVCVCAGAGGVGKTTVSAAIALGMAQRGLRVAVVTIDPARRLADALGLDELGNEPQRVDADGELWAMMLDSQRTFDELIDATAPSPEQAATIKANRVYRELSGAVSGSQEFTAVAKLHELAQDDRFDLLVLDTPPSRNAIDFLEAPGRLTSFLDGSALRTLIRPAGLGMRVLGRGASPLIGALRRVTGLDLLTDLQTFFGLLGSMTEEFSVRATQVQALLRAPDTAFVIVTAATEPAVDEAIWFARGLQQSGLPFAGVVVNRLHTLADDAPVTLPRDLAARVAESFAEQQRLARRDARQLQRLHELGTPLIEVPQLDGDVHDVEGLGRVRASLFGG